MTKQFYTAHDAADFLGINAHTVRAWKRSGKLKAVMHKSNMMLFEHDELQRRKNEMQGERRPGPKRETK